MRRFEITLKHLTSIKGELCTRKLWDPHVFPTLVDRDWNTVANKIDDLIADCREILASTLASRIAASTPIDPLTGVRKDPDL